MRDTDDSASVRDILMAAGQYLSVSTSRNFRRNEEKLAFLVSFSQLQHKLFCLRLEGTQMFRSEWFFWINDLSNWIGSPSIGVFGV